MLENKMIRKNEWKDKWNTDISALKVYPNKKLAAICLTIVLIFILIESIWGGLEFDVVIIPVVIIPLSILCLGEAYLTRHFLLTHEGLYVHSWFFTFFYAWKEFGEICIERDEPGGVLVICFNRGTKHKGDKALYASNHPFKFFVFEFKGQVSKTTGRFQLGFPLVEKDEMVAFIKRSNLEVEGLDLLLNSMHNISNDKSVSDLFNGKQLTKEIIDNSTSKAVLKYLGFLISEYSFKYQIIIEPEYKGFYGPSETYSFYNDFGCFTLHHLAQRGEWGWYYSEKFSFNQTELLTNEIDASKYVKRQSFCYRSMLRKLAISIRDQIERTNSFFNIRIC